MRKVDTLNMGKVVLDQFRAGRVFGVLMKTTPTGEGSLFFVEVDVLVPQYLIVGMERVEG